jgi:hypothetical protein
MVGSEEAEFVRLVPEQMTVRDFSFTPSSDGL